MVTRKVKVNANNETDKVQNGQGARDEAFKRLLWIAKEHPETFYNNIWIFRFFFISLQHKQKQEKR
jgi:hypothetical protein